MTDDELRLMLDWRPSKIPFEQLSAEWKAWATAMIESAKVPANRHVHLRLEDSVQYLCRILCVFEGLFRGITADDLRGKFVSGLVLSGLPPERDCSFCFDQALRNAEGRGLVAHEDHGWGREQVRFYKLTPAGQRLATDVDPVQWENPSLRESPEADEAGAAIDVDGDELEVQETEGEDRSKRKHPGYLSSELRAWTGLTQNPLSKYAKAAGGPTPPRGGRIYRYPPDDARKILEHIRDNCSDVQIIANCKRALKDHFEITS